MAKAKVNQWISQLRGVGKFLRWDLPTIDKARWSLPWIQSARNPTIPSSTKMSPSKLNEDQGLTNRSLQLGDPAIPKVESERSAVQPQNGFISRALYYRRFYIKR
ncbi:uncharacterized protein LOC108092826 [Drosophila ficusphila]|uniref:uncharacterized protein LOC108092826 n=1 Tax=Drosophila ficusphila TaxID=30025 RepID=UPI0007E6309A|nr:uncharacterized protein LOC108092826 [Drosophila ficusphila]